MGQRDGHGRPGDLPGHQDRQHQAAGGPLHLPGWPRRDRAGFGPPVEPWLRHGPPVVCDALLLKHLDEKVARLHLPAMGAKLTVLSKEQSDYVDIPVNGPYKPDTYRY